MSKYELRYRVVENSSCNDFNNELKYTLVLVDYDPKTNLIRQRGFSGWGKHGHDLFTDKKLAEKHLCELNYNQFLNGKVELNKQLAELKAELEKLKFDYSFEKKMNDTVIIVAREYHKNHIKQTLNKTKVALRQRVRLMENKEHSYPQNAVLWEDIVDVLRQIEKGEENGER